MKIKFIEDREIEAQGEIVQRFKAGEVYELERPSAMRWLRRNAAVEVQGVITPPKKKRAQKKHVGTGKTETSEGSPVPVDTESASK